MKKFLSVVSILVMTIMMLAACATATPQVVIQTAVVTQVVQQTVAVPVQQTVVVNNVITATPEPATVTGTIRVGSWDSGDGLKPLNAAAADFQAAYPGVKVQVESVPQGYGDKLLAEFASGTQPDVMQVGDGDPSNFASKGGLEPLDDYISGKTGSNPLDTSVFYPAVFNIGKVSGKTYLVTKDYSPLVLFYNKKLFDAAGVAYPTDKWTWDDLLAAAQKLTVSAGGKTTQWGIELPDGWGASNWTRGIQPIIYQNGGSLISPDGKTSTGYVNSDATIAAIQWYVDLFNKFKVAPTDAQVAALSGQDLFQTQKVAMLWTGRWPISGYQADPKLNFGVAQLPTGTQRGNSICWSGYAMSSKSANKLTAWAFLKFVASGQGAQEFAKYALTADKQIADLQGLTTDPLNAPIMADLANVKPLEILSNLNYNTCVDGPLATAIQTYILKGGDLKALLTDVATKADSSCLNK
jgi:multiple sugar transport system substrate-binding protein